MSKNLDLVRSIYAEWERGDFSATGWAHPEIEYGLADGPDNGSGVGIAAMTATHRNWLKAWTEWCVEAEEYLELDGERVLVLFRFAARGKTSGLEIGRAWTKGASLFDVTAGEVVRIVQYFDRDHALADLGLAG
jgi:ketosteroid isomerase-like protein